MSSEISNYRLDARVAWKLTLIFRLGLGTRSYSHRFRKEGHTKVIEYSLVAKQKGVHKALGIKRPNVLRDQALVSAQPKKSASNGMDVDGGEGEASDDEEAMQVDGEAEEDDEEEEDDDEAIGNVRGRQTERIVTPDEVRAHLRRLFSNEQDLVTLIYAPHGPLARSSKLPTAPSTSTSTDSRPTASPDIFFMDVISVPPSRFRPAATMGDQKFENPQNGLLNGILRQSIVVKTTNDRLLRLLSNPEDAEFLGEDGKPKVDRARVTTQLYESLIELQNAVNSMVDSGKNPMRPGQGKQPPMGVKQLLEKKEGLFRKNMMVSFNLFFPQPVEIRTHSPHRHQGKRVNYAARSVISPDVNIETNEIGVPPVFARKLTFPEPVTPHNVNQLRQMVINGPHQHPGASFIQLEDGNLVSLVSAASRHRCRQFSLESSPTRLFCLTGSYESRRTYRTSEQTSRTRIFCTCSTTRFVFSTRRRSPSHSNSSN